MHSQQRTHALDHHQEAQHTEQKHVTDRNRQLDLTQSFEQRENPDPEKRAGKAADEQNVAHLEIDIAPAPMGGTPMKIRSGVRRKPPPTPNTPERNPTAAPRPSSKKTSSDTSAIGR